MHYVFSPTLPPPPRKVRRRVGNGCGLIFLRLFILPHTVAGLFLLSLVPTHFYVHLFGTPVTAVVDGSKFTTSKKGNKSYDIAYHYTIDGHRFDEHMTGSVNEPERARAGFTFDGRAAQFAEHGLFIERSKSMLGDVLPLLFAALFWNGVLSVFLYAAWVVPIRQRWLAKYGETTTGTITGRDTRKGKGTRYFALYKFTTPDGQTISSKRQVPRAVYEEAVDGTPVTILYSPRRPTWNSWCNLDGFVISPALG